jgi:hypothetical protein
MAVRFRLRTVLMMVAVAAGLAVWPASQWRKRSHEQAIVRRLEAKDAQVTVLGGDSSPLGAKTYRITVDEYVRLGPGSRSPDESRPANLRLTADDIRGMAELDLLESLDLHGDVLEPAAYAALGELKRLKSLRVSQGFWDDQHLRYLEPLVGLEELTLEQTEATDDGIARLQKALPKVAIVDD